MEDDGESILKLAEEVRTAMEMKFWWGLLKVATVTGLVIALGSIGTCTYRCFRDEGSCYVETYAGVSYVRRRTGPAPNDIWGPKIATIEEAPQAAKILGCQLR